MARYSLKVWANVRAQYETGQFSMESIGKLFGIPAKTIEYQCIKQRWVKGKTAASLAIRINESNLERFTRLGMPPDTVAEKVLDGITWENSCIERIARQIESIENENKGTEEDDGEDKSKDVSSTLKLLGSIIKDMAEFKRISLLYIQEYNKMTGNYAPTKTEVSVHPLIPDNLSRDELYNRIAAMIGGKIPEAELEETAENAVFEDIADKKIDDNLQIT